MMANVMEDVRSTPNGVARHYGESISIVSITPQMAQEIWEQSEAEIARRGWDKDGGIRPIRRKMYAYVDDMKNGAWRDGDSMIIIGHTGAILDGRHRICALIQSQATAAFIVKIDSSGRSPMEVKADQNIGRTAAEVIGKHSRLIAAARVLANASTGRQYVFPRSHSRIDSIVGAISPQAEALTHSTSPGVSQAAMFGAVCLAMWRFKADASGIAEQYNAAVLGDRSLPLWPGWSSVVRQSIESSAKGKGGSNLQRELFLKASYALEPENRRVSRIGLRDMDKHAARLAKIAAEYIGVDSPDAA